MADYYAILGISHAAETDEVAKAYRRAALTYNPQCNPDADDPAELARRFKLVAQAYTVLSDPKTRAVYDAYGEDGVRHGGTAGGSKGLAVDDIDPDEVFRRFFGVDNPFQVIQGVSGLHGTQHRFYSEAAAQKPPPAAVPVPVTVSLTLEEVLRGAAKTIQFKSHDGSTHIMEVNIPKGVRTGMRLPFSHPRGGAVDVNVDVLPHKLYERVGATGDALRVTIPISLADALCGTAVDVPLIDGRTMSVLLDEVAHPQYELTIAGEGLPSLATGKRGDLVVRYATAFPKYLTAEQKREIRRILA